VIECYWPVMHSYYATGKARVRGTAIQCITLDGVWLSNEEVLKVGCWLPQLEVAYWWPDCVRAQMFHCSKVVLQCFLHSMFRTGPTSRCVVYVVCVRDAFGAFSRSNGPHDVRST
jgi:hypothetical protein